ncbi:MAG: hypothetical protein ACODAU_06655 [Myxococcota bacterium]
MVERVPPEDPFTLDPYDDRGVDRSLIRWMLSLTPTERLRVLQEHIDWLSRAGADGSGARGG